jgi:hypothetical protein
LGNVVKKTTGQAVWQENVGFSEFRLARAGVDGAGRRLRNIVEIVEADLFNPHRDLVVGT